MVVETPDTVGTGRFEGVCEDKPADDFEVSVSWTLATVRRMRVFIIEGTHGSKTPKTKLLSTSPSPLSLPSPKAPSFHKHPKNAKKLSSWPVP